MSKETREWLSRYTLIGFTAKRGNAWHYRQGDGNHYTGAVPIEDVRRRLFDWHPEAKPVYVDRFGEPVPNVQAITRSDTGAVLGIFSDSYWPHEYDRWLLANVEMILDDNLQIGSAGLLEGGAVAWVQVEMPENVETAEGVVFRPWLNAFSSLNGKFATTYKTGVTNIVCDNTMRAAQGERTEQFRVKSTARSLQRITQAREALGLVFSVGEDFEAEVKALCATDFTNRQFDALTAQLAPITTDMKPRAVTLAQKKRDTLQALWANDERVTPWRGTAWGAYQAVNTYGQHVSTVRGGNRPHRNMMSTLSGRFDESDTDALSRIMTLAA